MRELLSAAQELQSFCDNHEWKMCFIGGISVQRWGEPRFTKDADITLLTGFGEEGLYIDELLKVYRGRVANPKQFALRNRVLLLESIEHIPIDIALGALPFEENTIQRATFFTFSETCRLKTCSAEDLIVHKAFANRPQDWIDIESILIRQSKLQIDLIWEELIPLIELKEEPSIEKKLSKLIQKRLKTKSVRGRKNNA